MENRQFQRRSYQERGRQTTSDGFVRQGAVSAGPRLHLDSSQFTATQVPARQEQPAPTPVAVVSPTPLNHQPFEAATPPQATLRLDMRVPGAAPLLHQPAKIILSRWRFMRTPAFKTAASSLALLLLVGGWLLGQLYFNLQRSFQGDATTAVSLQKKVNPNLLKGEGDGRVNILLLGNGGAGHEAPDLTDTIMLASIDPVNGKVALVSVPRDLWISLPGHGNMKINAAFETGKYDYLGKIESSNSNKKAIEAGFATADQAVEQVLGVSIHYNMLVNFISFRQAVNTLGGVSVNVPETLRDPTMAWENNWNPVLASKGQHIFNGKQALLYVRSRHTSSDFARSDRQRAVLTAIKDKAATLGTLSNPLKLSGLINTFGNNVKTDLSLGDASRVYSLTKSIPNNAITSFGLGDETTKLVTTGRAAGQSIVLPLAGLNNYTAIHDYVRQRLPDGYIIKEHASVQVYNASNDPEIGKATVAELKTYGYVASDEGAYPTPVDQTQLIDLSHGSKQYTKHYLERRFGVQATTAVPEGVQTGGGDFIILLGNNATTPQ